MVQPCPANIGDYLDDIITPALIVELNAYERNLKKAQELIGSSGVSFRPHSKTHKSPKIALDQIAHGAVGICCQKISEAEIMVKGGIEDVYISNQVIGRQKTLRVAALAKAARISVCVDDETNIAELSAAAQHHGCQITVLVEIEVGMERCGVPAGEPALELANLINAAPGLTFGGLQAYQGNAQHIKSYDERYKAHQTSSAITTQTAELFKRAGVALPLLTGGGTGSLEIDLEIGVLGELQAGSYIFMDVDYGSILSKCEKAFSTFDHSLFVQASIISTPQSGRAIVDAGLKALAFDSGNPLIFGGCGRHYTEPSDEHGTIELSAASPASIGETMLLVPGHCDPTVNLYDWYVGVRDGIVEDIWPVEARGALG